MIPQWLQDLIDEVTKKLIAEHDFSMDDADEAITESRKDNPSHWNENADVTALANSLASDSEEE